MWIIAQSDKQGEDYYFRWACDSYTTAIKMLHNDFIVETIRGAVLGELVGATLLKCSSKNKEHVYYFWVIEPTIITWKDINESIHTQ